MITACMEWVKLTDKTKKAIAAEVVSEYLIGSGNMAKSYISPNAFYGTIEEELDLWKFDCATNRTAGLRFFE
jgi:hypothetical protein